MADDAKARAAADAKAAALDVDGMKLASVLDRMKARIEGGGQSALVDTVAMPTCETCGAVGTFNHAGQIQLVHDREKHHQAVQKHLSEIKAPKKVAKAVAGSWYDNED